MKFVPGPDLPCGGKIVGLDGIRDAYLTGRGSFRTRATTRIENVTPRKKGIVVTELPYTVGPEKVIEKIKDLVQAKKLQGISDVKDLTDRKHGLRLVIEIKNGFHPEAVLEQLYKLTPMEDSFGINNVALVDGQPRTLGLKDLLRVYVDFRTDVVRRRTAYRLRKREERLHLVEGLLIAILDIDEVIQLIRTSDDAAVAKARLMDVFDLSELQATYILDLQLRRLTKFSRIELETEQAELQRQIEELRAILGDEKLLLQDRVHRAGRGRQGARHPAAHRAAGVGRYAAAPRPRPLEVADDPCWVLLSSTGLMARTTSDDPLSGEGGRHKHDAVVAAVRTTARGEVGLVTSRGRMIRLSALELPTLPPTNGAPSLSGGAPLAAFVDLPRGEEPLTITSLSTDSPGLALGTAQGVVKRVTTDYPGNRDDWEVIAPQGRRRGRRRGRAGHGRRRTSSSSPPTPSCCTSPPPASGPRAAPPAAWPASSWLRRRPGRLLRRGGPGGAQPRGHLQRLLGRAARHRARVAQGHPVLRVPGQGPRHRRRPGAPVPAGRGHPRPRPGSARRPARAAAANGVAVELPAATGKRDGSGTPPRRRSPRWPARCPARWWSRSDAPAGARSGRRDAVRPRFAALPPRRPRRPAAGPRTRCRRRLRRADAPAAPPTGTAGPTPARCCRSRRASARSAAPRRHGSGSRSSRAGRGAATPCPSRTSTPGSAPPSRRPARTPAAGCC